MVETHAEFARRLSRLSRKHAQMSRGYVNVLTRDGLIVAKPVRPKSGISGLRLIALAVMVFFLFKAVSLAMIGPQAYADRLAPLKEGTVVEQAGATVLAMDPVTRALADWIAPLLG
jgi:hypothetical protein